MDTLKTLDLIQFNQSNKSQLQGASGNKNIWLSALEKSSLYSSLEKFEVIDSHKKFNVTVNETTVDHQENKESKTNNERVIKTSMVGLKPTNLEKTIFQTNNTVNYKNQIQFDKEAVNLLNTNHQHVFNLITSKKNNSVRMAGLYKSNEMRMPWLSKNASVTISNLGLEVWVRDTGITGGKLSEVLKSLQHTMAHLGASLAKVTVNGKVVFNHKNHDSIMER